MTHNVHGLQMQGIEQVVVVDYHVDDVVDVVDTRAGLKPRVRWGVDSKVLGEFDQKRLPATQAASPMEKEQGRTTAVGAKLGLEHAVANGNRFFFHLSFQSLPGWYVVCPHNGTLSLRLQHTRRTGPCQLFPGC